ncbi:hypothetical protein PRIPAC_71628 [Pristionchus pacificus]|uniref:G protein-coupled receptor n=1 Tax=Pristionchus pacificus TaxID=54126 RepID=A0A2A6C6E5_PRIPA|nr:hypothetical protein PRIPAC_71628 [Pristionchus pacificus]|eukprot:PDM73686.1 G protein-coupled receptor [Pristionchus pacificus]
MLVVWLVVDAIFFVSELYLLICLKLAKDPFFGIPFFHFFIVAGIGGILSVIGFVLHRFLFTEDLAWIFKLGYVLNSFGVTLATLGKLCIVINRFVVMRNGRLLENVWTRRTTVCLTILIMILSTAKSAPYLFCSYSYTIVDNVRYILFLDSQCLVSEKPLTSAIYFAYAVVSVILTGLSIRDLNKMSRHVETSTRLMVLQQQRKMLIVTGVCTISHIIKGLHQAGFSATWVLIAAFKLTAWSAVIKDSYQKRGVWCDFEPRNMELVLNIIDVILISAELYLLIWLKIAKDPFFHIPFFHFFIVTGIGGILSVIGYILDVRFILVEDLAWIFKLGYVLNSFGVTLSTLGKLCIVINRFVVMRNGRLVERNWTRRVTVCLTIIVIVLSSAKCSPFLFCEYSYIEVENDRYVAYFDGKCVVSEKPLTSAIYFAYVVISVILTAISIRDLRKLSKNAEIATRLIVLKQQRNMLIVTGIWNMGSNSCFPIDQLKCCDQRHVHNSTLSLNLLGLGCHDYFIDASSQSSTVQGGRQTRFV